MRLRTRPNQPVRKNKLYILELIKFKPTLLALAAVMAGFVVAGNSPVNYLLMSNCVFGAFLVGAGANAWNQLIEIPHDAIMKRTSKRPLVTGEISPLKAVWIATTLSISGVVYLLLFVNYSSAWWAFAMLLIYTLFYTPLKRKNSSSLYVGAISGALPPVIGWSAAKGSAQFLEVWVIFAILFFWQIPHFIAIAWLHKQDYDSAGYRMVDTSHQNFKKLSAVVLINHAFLLSTSFCVYFIGISGFYYLLVSAILGIGFLASSILWLRSKKQKDALTSLRFSILYLVGVVLLMCLDKA